MDSQKLTQIFRAKHELWLKYLFSSFAIADENIKNKLQDMANIEFRHLKWLSNKLLEEGVEYDYERNHLNIKLDNSHQYFDFLISQTKSVMKHYEEDILFARIISDEYHFISVLENLLANSEDIQITAFNMNRKYQEKNLDETSTDALTLFLFEETYKEYELILIYSYMQNHTKNITLYNVYQD
jgi:rubrerythrin